MDNFLETGQNLDGSMALMTGSNVIGLFLWVGAVSCFSLLLTLLSVDGSQEPPSSPPGTPMVSPVPISKEPTSSQQQSRRQLTRWDIRSFFSGVLKRKDLSSAGASLAACGLSLLFMVPSPSLASCLDNSKSQDSSESGLITRLRSADLSPFLSQFSLSTPLGKTVSSSPLRLV